MKSLLLVFALLFSGLQAQADGRVILAPPTAYTATGTSGLAVAANFNRKYLLIQNNGSTSVYLKPGSAHSASEGIVLVAGGVWEPIVVPVDAIYAKSASSTDALVIQEGN